MQTWCLLISPNLEYEKRDGNNLFGRLVQQPHCHWIKGKRNRGGSIDMVEIILVPYQLETRAAANRMTMKPGKTTSCKPCELRNPWGEAGCVEQEIIKPAALGKVQVQTAPLAGESHV
jgi:hypothetical protein